MSERRRERRDVVYRRVRGRVVPIRVRRQKRKKSKETYQAGAVGAVAGGLSLRVSEAIRKSEVDDLQRIKTLRKRATFKARVSSIVKRSMERNFPTSPGAKVRKRGRSTLSQMEMEGQQNLFKGRYAQDRLEKARINRSNRYFKQKLKGLESSIARRKTIGKAFGRGALGLFALSTALVGTGISRDFGSDKKDSQLQQGLIITGAGAGLSAGALKVYETGLGTNAAEAAVKAAKLKAFKHRALLKKLHRIFF